MGTGMNSQPEVPLLGGQTLEQTRGAHPAQPGVLLALRRGLPRASSMGSPVSGGQASPEAVTTLTELCPGLGQWGVQRSGLTQVYNPGRLPGDCVRGSAEELRRAWPPWHAPDPAAPCTPAHMPPNQAACHGPALASLWPQPECDSCLRNLQGPAEMPPPPGNLPGSASLPFPSRTTHRHRGADRHELSMCPLALPFRKHPWKAR